MSEDIAYVKELSSLSKSNGVTFEQFSLLLKKVSLAMRMESVSVGNDY